MQSRTWRTWSVIGSVEFRVFSVPVGDTLVIEPTPRLASWMRSDHPDQIRLREYLDWLEREARTNLPSGDAALDLTVAMRSDRPLTTGGGDLDNYLFPLVRRLGSARFLSVWASKRHGQRSTVVIGPAMSTDLPDTSWQFATAETSQPVDTNDWKEDVDAQIRAQVTVEPAGPVQLQIAYVLSPSRNWTNLWKPTIDSLGAIVGDGLRPFDPKDDRIVRLGLHRAIAREARRSIAIGVWSRPGLPRGAVDINEST